MKLDGHLVYFFAGNRNANCVGNCAGANAGNNNGIDNDDGEAHGNNNGNCVGERECHYSNNLLQISRDLSVTKFLGYPEFFSQSLKEPF